MTTRARLVRSALVVLALALTLGAAAPVAAEDPITRDQAERLIQEIRQLREVLQQLRAPQPAAAAPQRPADEKVKVDLRGTHVMGRNDAPVDRKSTRLNSSHRCISYAVFCLKKKK